LICQCEILCSYLFAYLYVFWEDTD
jgi:hypothetical protein